MTITDLQATCVNSYETFYYMKREKQKIQGVSQQNFYFIFIFILTSTTRSQRIQLCIFLNNLFPNLARISFI